MMDLIDTALKVGLGAAISGVAMYGIARYRHQSDMRKEAAARRVEILTDATALVETYFIAFGKCEARLTGLLRQGVSPGPLAQERLESYRRADVELTDARAVRHNASSKLALIGEFEAADLISSIGMVEKKLRDKVIFEQCLPSEAEVKQIAEEMRAVRAALLLKLAAAFRDAYA